MAALIPRPDYPPYSARSADEGREEVDGILSRMEHKVHKEYLQAAREMKEKADDYLTQFLAEDERRAKMVAEGKMSAAEWKQWRISHIATGRRWYEQAAVLAADMTNANKIAAGIINGELPEVFATGFNYALYQGEITGGFQTSFTLYDRETVARMLKEEPELMPIEAKINVPKDMLWNTKQLTSAMTQAIIQGEKIEDIASRLVSSVTGMNENTAIRNARTATTSAENGGRYNGYRKLQAAGADLTIEWCATLDGRTRHTHRLLDGQRRDVDKPFEVDGQKILYAGDPYAPQGLVWNCRCTLLCWVKGFEESLMLKAQTHPDGMSYAEWKFAKQEEYERRKAAPKKPRVNPDNPAYGTPTAEEKAKASAAAAKLAQKAAYTGIYEWGTIPKDAQESYEKTLDMLSKRYPMKNKPVEWVGDFRIVHGYSLEDDFIDIIDNNPEWEGVGAQFLPFSKYAKKPQILIVDPETSVGTAEEYLGALLKIRKESGWHSAADSFYNLVGNTETTIIHEYAHALANDCGIYKSQIGGEELRRLFAETSKEEIGKQLSKYAASNPDEMFAEAFVQSFAPEEFQSDLCRKCMDILRRARGEI